MGMHMRVCVSDPQARSTRAQRGAPQPGGREGSDASATLCGTVKNHSQSQLEILINFVLYCNTLCCIRIMKKRIKRNETYF